MLRFVRPHLHVRLSLLPLRAPLRPASHQAYGVRVPLSFLWRPDSHAPRHLPAPPSRQSPPTPLTYLTRRRSPRFPARRLVRKDRSGALASGDDVSTALLTCSSFPITEPVPCLQPLQEPVEEPYKNNKLQLVTYRPEPTFNLHDCSASIPRQLNFMQLLCQPCF